MSPLPTRQLIVQGCLDGNLDQAYASLQDLLAEGYSPLDVITTLFRVIKVFPMPEFTKLEFVRVREPGKRGVVELAHSLTSAVGRRGRGVDEGTQEVGMTHLRIVEGVQSPIQLTGLIARLCRIAVPPADAVGSRS